MSNFLRDIKISTKISVLVGLTVLLMASVVVLGLRHISTIGKEVTAAAEEDIPLLEAVSKITFHSLEQSIHLERAIQFGKRMAQDNAAKNKFEIERRNFLQHGRMIAQEIEENRTLIEQMSKTHKTPEIRDMLLSVDYELRNIHKQQADYQFSAELVFNLFSQGKLAQAEPTIQKITEKTEEEEHFEQETSLKNFVLAVKNFVEKSIARLKRNQQAAMRTMLLFSAFILLFSLVFGILISHGIKKPLSMAVNTAQRIAAGDRDVKIGATAKDETGQLLETMNKMSYSINEKEEALRQANMDLHAEIAERKKAQKELQESMGQLERFNRLAMRREGRVIELKREVNDLLAELNREPEYKSIKEIAEISAHKSDIKE